MKIAVTGATGHLGSRVVAHLHNKNHATALINEGLEIREIDFQNRASLEKAFAGIDSLVYVASKTYSVFDRVGELENVLAAMKTNGIKNLVVMSFIADQEDNPFVMSPFYGYLPR
jgi:NAD(P)H dehydrogenase (quinone)